tara:strand:+ start:3221 stop:3541 length:321 start_codon:yes stop_codon:yes gene_type:complete
MDLSLGGLTLFSFTREGSDWELGILFFSIGWLDTLYVSVGGPLWLYVDSSPAIGICLGDDEGGHKIEGMSAVLVILGGILVARFQWWSVLIGLTLWWLSNYTLEVE